MAAISMILARLKREPLDDLPLVQHFEQLLKSSGLVWRERLLGPLVTLRLFMIQILSGNCAIAALRQLSGMDFAPSSYSAARDRLPLQLLQSLLRWMSEQAQQRFVKTTGPKLQGPRVLIADGSTFSTKDTPQLRERFQLARGTREGVGYPMGKLMGLLDAATGMFVSLLALPLFQHDSRSVISLHPMLQKGDILLGDRAFCSFAHLVLLNARGVFACVRLHQRRKDKLPGMQRWKKQANVPAWMTAAQHALMPAFIDVRLVRYAVEQKGCRTWHVLVITTLLDKKQWPDKRIAELYGARWQIETCFDHLKTTMNMNQLKCETVEGVMKELAIFFAVYNLVRLAMLIAAQRQKVDVARISFVDALRFLQAQILGLPGVSRLITNPDRRGRHQLRVIRGRLKEYDLLTKSRRETERQIAENQMKNA
jgi:hypothetical protein